VGDQYRVLYSRPADELRLKRRANCLATARREHNAAYIPQPSLDGIFGDGKHVLAIEAICAGKTINGEYNMI